MGTKRKDIFILYLHHEEVNVFNIFYTDVGQDILKLLFLITFYLQVIVLQLHVEIFPHANYFSFPWFILVFHTPHFILW